MTKLDSRVEQLLYKNASDFEIAKVIKEDIKIYFKTLPYTFSQTGGKDFLLKHTHKIDSIVRLVYKIASRSMFEGYLPMKHSIPIAVAGMGSYGREQLCVHSDIDLMIVYEDIPAYKTKEFIEKMLYLFWDAGLKLGHRVHELSELPKVAKSDITIKSAILESRFIEGSKFLWTKAENSISAIRKDNPEKYIRQKLEEQKKLHKRFPLTMEPNLKEGFGGFRNANLVFWIGKLLHNAPRIKDLPSNIINEIEYREFRIAIEFLFRVRSALHLVAGKKHDTLALEVIPEVATLLGYDENIHSHMKFAKKTTESLRTIHLYTTIWLHNLISIYTPDIYDTLLNTKTPMSELLDYILFLNKNASMSFKPHPKLLKDILHSRKPEKLTRGLYLAISNSFRQSNTYAILQTLHEARLLKYMIPPIKKVVNLPQFDGYHTFSVDMHSLACLHHLENIKEPFLMKLYKNLDKDERHLLKIVTFLHDSGKGRKKEHALVGVSLFKIFAKNIEISDEMTIIGIKLIKYHDLMSITAQREDLYNEKTILDFASRFHTQRLLDLLYLLTYADMNGVGPGVYTSFKSGLLRTLYCESVNALKHDKILDSTARKLKRIETLKRNKVFSKLTKITQKKILSIPSNELFIYNSVAQILAITDMAHQIEDRSYIISNTQFLTIEIVRKTPLHLGHLLSKLSRLNIINLKVAKLFDDIKYFRVDFNEVIDNSEIPIVKQIIADAFSTNLQTSPPKPSIKKNDITIDCEHSREYATLRLNTKDQKGLLAYVAYLFDTLHIDIVSTKIHTSKYRANDLFLIQKDGNFCNNIDKIIEELTE